ncbi:MAG: HAMP domain-containing histidine kinase, partial [Deltaproteobacteria bacterium]|nr:HAMP domain-containing histidine kinase [Deltaproteobacteria bacterium]
PSGSGVGLSLCRKIIAAHAGTIEVSDSNLGGAEFTIRIPAEMGSGIR